MNRIADQVLNPNMLMFRDKASKDERTSAHRQGWALKESQFIQRKCFVRGRQFSILLILTLNGIIAYDIIEGSKMSEQFVHFLQELVICFNLSALIGDAHFQSDTTDKSISQAMKCAHFGQLSYTSRRGD